jgi:flagellar protein FlbD
MIKLTRIGGSVFVLNSDLVERVDATPDSVITLVDGKTYVVADSLDEIIDAIRTYRSEIIAVSTHLADLPPLQAPVPAPPDRPLASVASLPNPDRGET